MSLRRYAASGIAWRHEGSAALISQRWPSFSLKYERTGVRLATTGISVCPEASLTQGGKCTECSRVFEICSEHTSNATSLIDIEFHDILRQISKCELHLPVMHVVQLLRWASCSQVELNMTDSFCQTKTRNQSSYLKKKGVCVSRLETRSASAVSLSSRALRSLRQSVASRELVWNDFSEGTYFHLR